MFDLGALGGLLRPVLMLVECSLGGAVWEAPLRCLLA